MMRREWRTNEEDRGLAGAHATFTEIWTGGGPDLMVGLGVTVVPGRPTEFEFLRIERRAGRHFYVAQPGGVPQTRGLQEDGRHAPPGLDRRGRRQEDGVPDGARRLPGRALKDWAQLHVNVYRKD